MHIYIYIYIYIYIHISYLSLKRYIHFFKQQLQHQFLLTYIFIYMYHIYVQKRYLLEFATLVNVNRYIWIYIYATSILSCIYFKSHVQYYSGRSCKCVTAMRQDSEMTRSNAKMWSIRSDQSQINLNKPNKAWWTLDLPQTSRANPVQCYSTHQEKRSNAKMCYICIEIYLST